MFKVGDIVKSKFGVMHTVAYVDDNVICFVEGCGIYTVANDPNDWTICTEEVLQEIKASCTEEVIKKLKE